MIKTSKCRLGGYIRNTFKEARTNEELSIHPKVDGLKDSSNIDYRPARGPSHA